MLSLNLFSFFLSFIFGVGGADRAQATEIFEPLQAIRQLGMGGVYVFDENDGSSFIQNPAYTCFTKGMNWSLLNLGVGLGDTNQLSTFRSNSNVSSSTDLANFYGKSFYAGLGGFTSLTLPCFGAAAYFTRVANFKMNNPAFPTMNLFSLSEYGFKIGGGIPLGPNLAFGLNASRVDRKGGRADIGPETLTEISSTTDMQNLIESIDSQGVAYGLDVGLVGRLSEVPLNPTLSVSWKDVGSTQFTKSAGSDSPERQKDNLIVGTTVGSSLYGFGFALGLEYRHVNDTNEQIGKKLHAGAELQMGFIDLRAGFYQGYYTYGASLDLWLMQFDAALYTVEKGVYPGQSPEQRVLIGVMMELEFDPSFKLVEAGGKKRRFKQRR